MGTDRMSTAARIEELLGKFDENPRRYFAPLANEYRKAGDLAQAIAICREHLPKQPGHMSGHIVFGQALYESGELDEAQEIFEAALALDPENLIALRHLGDIARQRGDTIGARRWYGRVLDADPRNDDIAALIAALPSRVTPMASSAIAEPTVVASTPPAADETAGSFADEPAWHTPSFLQSTPSAPPSAPVDAAPPPSAPPVELLDLDGPLDDVAPSPVEATLPIDGFAATHDETAHDEIGDTLAVDALASVVEPVSGAHAIDEALGAFASHDPLDLDVVAVTEETIDIVEASATPSEPLSPIATTLDGIAFDATDAIEAAPLDLAPAFDTVAVEAELVEAAPFVEAGSDAEVDAAEGLEAAYAEIGGPDDVASAIVALEETTDEAVAAHADPLDELVEPATLDDTSLAFEEGLLAEEWPSPESIHSRPLTPSLAQTPAWSTPVEASEASEASEAVADEPVEVETPSMAGGASEEFAADVIEPAPFETESHEIGASEIEALEIDGSEIEALEIDGAETEPLEFAVPEAEAPETDDAEIEAETDLALSAFDLDAIEAAGDAATAQDDVATLEVELASFEVEVEADLETGGPEIDSPEAVVDGDLQDAVDRAITDDLPYSIETEPVAAVAPVDEDPPLSAAEMSWLSVAEEEREAEQDVMVLSSDEDLLDTGATASDDGLADEAADVAADSADIAPVEHVASGGFVTETMAELLVAQGFTARAIGVYEELVRRRPYDEVLVSRLAELRAQASASETEAPVAEASIDETPAASATPISATPISATPIGTPAYSATPAFSATPASVTPLGIGAIAGTPRSVPLVAPAPSRTAREWLAAVAARRVRRPTPSAAPSVPSSTPANGTPAASVYETPADGLASLFGDTGQPAAVDEQAATSLASAFGGVTPAEGRDLFEEIGREAPEASAPLVEAPAAVPATDDTFSFDRFFPDPARTPDAATSTAEGTPSAAGTAARPSGATEAINPTQELAQFANWLKGLSNT